MDDCYWIYSPFCFCNNIPCVLQHLGIYSVEMEVTRIPRKVNRTFAPNLCWNLELVRRTNQHSSNPSRYVSKCCPQWASDSKRFNCSHELDVVSRRRLRFRTSVWSLLPWLNGKSSSYFQHAHAMDCWICFRFFAVQSAILRWAAIAVSMPAKQIVASKSTASRVAISYREIVKRQQEPSRTSVENVA